MMTTRRLVGDLPLMSDLHLAVSDSSFYTPTVYKPEVGKLLPMTYPRTRPLFNLKLTLPDSSVLEWVSKGGNLDVSKQLNDMRSLQNGWLEGEGLAPPEAGLSWLSGAFERHFQVNTPAPHLYPTPIGGIQAEWSLGPNEVTFEVNLDTRSGEWHELNLETNDSHERLLDCNNNDAWKWLVARIRDLSGTNL